MAQCRRYHPGQPHARDGAAGHRNRRRSATGECSSAGQNKPSIDGQHPCRPESSKERTGINGKLLVKNILAAVGDRIDAWEGYQTKESYTMQPITGKLTITPKTFSKVLRHEFNRLAGLADTIDAAIVVARS